MQLTLRFVAPGFLNSSCTVTVVVRPSFEVTLEGGRRCRLPAPLVVAAVRVLYSFSTRSPAAVLARASAVVAVHVLVPGPQGALLVRVTVGRGRCGT